METLLGKKKVPDSCLGKSLLKGLRGIHSVLAGRRGFTKLDTFIIHYLLAVTTKFFVCAGTLKAHVHLERKSPYIVN
jgi:hypothetical protein